MIRAGASPAGVAAASASFGVARRGANRCSAGASMSTQYSAASAWRPVRRLAEQRSGGFHAAHPAGRRTRRRRGRERHRGAAGVVRDALRGRHQHRRQRVEPRVVEAEARSGQRQRGGGLAAVVEHRGRDVGDAVVGDGADRIAAPTRQVDGGVRRLARRGRQRVDQRTPRRGVAERDQRQARRAVAPEAAGAERRGVADRLPAGRAGDDDAGVAVGDRELHRLAGGVDQRGELVLGAVAQVEPGPRGLREFKQPEAGPPGAVARVAADQAALLQHREHPVQRRAGQAGGRDELGRGRRLGRPGDAVEQVEGLVERGGARARRVVAGIAGEGRAGPGGAGPLRVRGVARGRRRGRVRCSLTASGHRTTMFPQNEHCVSHRGNRMSQGAPPPLAGVYPIVATPSGRRHAGSRRPRARRRVHRAAGADGLVFPGVASEFDADRRRAPRAGRRRRDGARRRRPLVVGVAAADAATAVALTRHSPRSTAPPP